MKITNYFVGLFTCLTVTAFAQAQNKSVTDSTGFPGDNFSLQGALKMFQKSSSLENFEKLINAKDNHVNNLDLNRDGQTDYVRVVDHIARGAHAVVMQAIVSEKQNQDIAVIELEKKGDTTVVLQIIGDENIYGKKVIVEPGAADNTVANGSNKSAEKKTTTVVVNVWTWPAVHFIYAPVYTPWISPWKWNYYPAGWYSWRPYAWNVWHPYVRPYYVNCAVVTTHRAVYAPVVYAPARVSSATVFTTNTAAVNGYGAVRTNTTVVGPRGNVATRTTTAVRGPAGVVRTSRTTFKKF